MEPAREVLKKLKNVMISKQTNLCIAVDFKDLETTLKFIEEIGDEVCIIKTHLDKYRDQSFALQEINKLKEKYNFLLFEDRKFADSKETTKDACQILGPIVDIVTVHPGLGDEMFEAIAECSKISNVPLACFAVVEMSFKGLEWTSPKTLYSIAERHANVCLGIIAQQFNDHDSKTMIKASPGVHISKSSDGAHQQWNSPEVVMNRGADILIVGRGITSARKEEWKACAQEYKKIGWNIFTKSEKAWVN